MTLTPSNLTQNMNEAWKTKPQLEYRGDYVVRNVKEKFYQLWDLMLTGMHTPAQILTIANKEWGFRTRPTCKTGGKGLARSVIYRMFIQPFYYGWFEYPQGSGRYYRGKHQPMITEAEYDRVQMLLGKRGNLRPQLRLDFAFTGMIRCGDCGRMVTAEEKHQIICGNCRFKFAHRKHDG